ncbi:MAG: HipA N-terminal domain-containing protein [Thermodesulfobacteriota bacterium]|nr:HipA N-terminal domain-containing protein [Thermodesulfobacteriota bacterium]
MDRIGKVFFNNIMAGILINDNDGYHFIYDHKYLAIGPPLSFNLPLQEESFTSDRLFSFFDNLAAEGWLKKIQCKAQKINENDTFGLLLKNGRDLVGSVTIIEGQK